MSTRRLSSPALVADNFGLDVVAVTITADWSSLNSLNGLVDVADGRRYFFKFHQEEGEEGTVEEYYRAELLQRAGLPVDMPAMMSPEARPPDPPLRLPPRPPARRRLPRHRAQRRPTRCP